MDLKRTLLYTGCGVALLHAGSYLVQGVGSGDHVQVGHAMGRLVLVICIGAASVYYEANARIAQQNNTATDTFPSALCLLAALFFALVWWPTVYRSWWGTDGYDYRTHRLTGATLCKYGERWKPVSPNSLPPVYRNYP
jgi:hypothetical protein